MHLLLFVAQLLLLLAVGSVGLIIFLMADRIARVHSWILFSPLGWLTIWIWGENNSNFTREGTRTFTRWYLRLFGLAWIALVVFGSYLNRH
ncbi:MAG: hypothetical protein M3P30_00700 [Chloroflexota bacterium]|nr:hypothetical protein [Chloroflexota bacterium]